MSEYDIIGLICVACLDVCAGICFDFTSLRHSFTENLCSCSCCRCCQPPSDDDEVDEERAPLLRNAISQPQ
ncbi:unnamed protein product, partial [Mycena citricolor]